MKFVAAGLFVLSYLLAVVDGTLQEKGTIPSSTGRIGLVRYCKDHPLILAGAACGIAGVVVGLS